MNAVAVRGSHRVSYFESVSETFQKLRDGDEITLTFGIQSAFTSFVREKSARPNGSQVRKNRIRFGTPTMLWAASYGVREGSSPSWRGTGRTNMLRLLRASNVIDAP